MADRIRAGIIGTGFMGRVHAHAVRAAGADLVAVAGSSPERAGAAASELGAVRPAADAAELIAAADVDVVHVCTPNDTHHDLALAALAAGKHVVCEKPLATTLSAAQQLAEEAVRRSVVAAVPFVYRWYPMVREARARVVAGETGPLRLLHGSYLQDWLAEPSDDNWRVDPARGGASRAFADIGVHWCDLVEFVTGHRITRLVADARTMIPERGGNPVSTEDAASVLFTTDQGATGSVVISQVSPGKKNQLAFRLDGALAALSFDQEVPDALVVGTRRHTTVVPRDASALSAAAAPYSVLPPGHPQGYQDVFNAFVSDVYRAIGGQVPDGLATFDDGRRAAVITDAVMRSAASGSWVEVPR
ncbi:Gfo/Idh/MocA family oxidoreductase [Nocardioides maradonensis]